MSLATTMWGRRKDGALLQFWLRRVARRIKYRVCIPRSGYSRIEGTCDPKWRVLQEAASSEPSTTPKLPGGDEAEKFDQDLNIAVRSIVFLGAPKGGPNMPRKPRAFAVRNERENISKFPKKSGWGLTRDAP
jgi:hypothetical protein